jgi:hypothetical protein
VVTFNQLQNMLSRVFRAATDFTRSHSQKGISSPTYLNFSPFGLHSDNVRELIIVGYECCDDRLCGLVVRVLDYRSGGLGSIPGTARFSGKKKKKENSSGSGTGSTQPREYNRGAT